VPHETRGESTLASVESKSMDTPDETRSPDKTLVNVEHLGSATVARLRVEPGVAVVAVHKAGCRW